MKPMIQAFIKYIENEEAIPMELLDKVMVYL